jgi:hypothetical protein
MLATASVVSLRLVVIIAIVAVPAQGFATSATLVNVTLTGQGLFGSVAGAIGCRQGAGAGRRGETHPNDAAANRVGLGSRPFSEACDTHGGRWELTSAGSGAELRLTVDYEGAVPTEWSLARLKVPEESGALLPCPSWLGGDSVKRG